MKTWFFHSRMFFPPSERFPYPKGKWSSEPDKVAWTHMDMPCLIMRNHVGALCGYIAVPEGHPWYGKEYGDIHAQVHGGLTYTHNHPPRGAPDGRWWLGFDCAHYGDFVPRLNFGRDGVYRDIEYVTKQIRKLATQAKAVQLQ